MRFKSFKCCSTILAGILIPMSISSGLTTQAWHIRKPGSNVYIKKRPMFVPKDISSYHLSTNSENSDLSLDNKDPNAEIFRMPDSAFIDDSDNTIRNILSDLNAKSKNPDLFLDNKDPLSDLSVNNKDPFNLEISRVPEDKDASAFVDHSSTIGNILSK